MKCFQVLGRPSAEFARVEFRDDGRYELTCSSGHQTTTVLQQQKFEILFQIGAHAILDGYYREAISSFTSGLERFYEFSIRVFLTKISKSDALFQSCWKTVSNQSERQLGAFVFLWASNFEAAPSLLSNSQIAFRNEVTHKGRIPTKEESVKYGNAVLEIIRLQIVIMQQRLPDEVQKVVFYHLSDSRADSDEGKHVATLCAATIVSLSIGEPSHHQKSLEEHLVDLMEWRKRCETI